MLAALAVDYATERLDDALWSEVAPLLESHWHEVAHYDDLPLDPDRDRYATIDANGGLRVFTARLAVPAPDRGRLIGYLALFVVPSLHYRSSIFALQDVLYVDPLHRGSRAGIGLIRHAHNKLRAEGVTVIFQHVKARRDLNIGPVLQRLLGYELVDEVYACRLDKES
ncbi:MAG: GNAT family N-acetyltransferase [Pseudomonadota bacterium]